MMRGGKIFRVLSSQPVEFEVLEFDDELSMEDNMDYVEYLEMSLVNAIKL